MNGSITNEAVAFPPDHFRPGARTISDGLHALVELNPEATILFDAEGVVLYANRAANFLTYSLQKEHGSSALMHLQDVHPNLIPKDALRLSREQGSWSGEVVIEGGRNVQKSMLVHVTALGCGSPMLFGLVARDISLELNQRKDLHQRNAELEGAYEKLKGAQDQILQSEKLASIGQLAAGVAHEINNPIGYVNSNISTLEKYVSRYLTVVQALSDALTRSAVPYALAELEEIKNRFDLDYLAKDVRQLVAESKTGIDRVCKIVRDLKDFSRRNSEANWTLTDVHKGIESTLNIAWNELKYKVQIVKSFADLPPIECVPSEINQVLLNLLLNAGQAIKSRGVITVTTGRSDSKIWIAIGDDGGGIAADVLPRIFDPFFTTKPAGEGTGLGLAISYGIVKKHQGDIQVTSVVGQGTLFRVELPIRQP